MPDTSILATAFFTAISPYTLLAVVIGMFWGIIVGALPGLGSIIAITICLPFTFGMDNVTAISLLLSVYCGSVYGGSITSILLNTPGAPQNAATCLDGFPMAKAGRANEALGWSTVASAAGGIFSCIILVLLGPQLARFAMHFGPVETFALIVMALTCISSVSRDSFIKGLIAGCIGLFLGVVGPDPMTGDMRFTFDIFRLSAGFDLVPVVIGVFALTELLDRASTTGISSVSLSNYTGMLLPKLRHWKGRLSVLLKSCAIGTGIGILPGTGAATAAFISYAEAKRSSPRKAGFGKGEPDGIISSESANNAVTGGALVPTLALGIPGDPVTAIMLTTLVIHGVTPGVRLMAENPDIVYASFIVLFICNLVMVPAGMAVARVFSRLLRTPEPLLMSTVGILCVLGAYGVRGLEFDVLVTICAALAGFGLRYAGAPLAPLVIGMVLSGQLEVSLRQGLLVTNGNFLLFFTDYPIAMALFGVTLLLLLWPSLFYLWKLRNGGSAAR